MIKSPFEDENSLFESRVSGINGNANTKTKIVSLFRKIGYTHIISRKNIVSTLGCTDDDAGDLIKKMKNAGLKETVSGHEKGPYQFRKLHSVVIASSQLQLIYYSIL